MKMEGYVDEFGQAKVDLSVDGFNMGAVIDTGFNGDLCLPLQVGIQLQLKLRNITTTELADGSKKRELLFSGDVTFGEETKEAEIMLTESDEALIGTRMFSQLEIDFPNQKVRIE